MPSSFATRAIGRDVSITILTASSLNSDEKLFFGRGNYFTFPEVHPNGWTVRKLRGTPDATRMPYIDVMLEVGSGNSGTSSSLTMCECRMLCHLMRPGRIRRL